MGTTLKLLELVVPNSIALGYAVDTIALSWNIFLCNQVCYAVGSFSQMQAYQNLYILIKFFSPIRPILMFFLYLWGRLECS